MKGYLLNRGTTWNDLQQVRNNLQQARNNLKQPETRNDLKRSTTSKTQPTVTWTYLRQAKKKKDANRPTSRFSDYFTTWAKRFSSLTYFPLNIWLQSFENCFTENEGESRVSSIYHHASSVNYHVYFYRILDLFFLFGFQVSRERERLLF